TGAVRLWIHPAVLSRWLEDRPVAATLDAWSGRAAPPNDELAAFWRAIAGTVVMPRGVSRLRAGSVLPLDGRPLLGSPQSPQGTIQLVIDLSEGGRFWFAAEPIPQSGGGSLRVTRVLQKDPFPREAVP